MNRCPISYQLCCHEKYSEKGLKLLSRNLKHLNDFPFTAQEQVQLALQLFSKLSIQGVQPKLSVALNAVKGEFEVVERFGEFILKPPHQHYEELPQNEDVTMRLAKTVGIEVPLHGMIYNKDGSLSYFIKRFDRLPRKKKAAVEDFSQLLGFSRDTKYECSMEKMILVIEKHCTFPSLEKIKFFRRAIFNFLIGNEDMHLKNFTLLQRDAKVELSPAYDLLNTTIVLNAKEEIALPIRGKKSRLTYSDLVEYLGQERLGLRKAVIEEELLLFGAALGQWRELLAASFLSPPLRNRYEELIHARWQRLQ